MGGGGERRELPALTTDMCIGERVLRSSALFAPTHPHTRYLLFVSANGDTPGTCNTAALLFVPANCDTPDTQVLPPHLPHTHTQHPPPPGPPQRQALHHQVHPGGLQPLPALRRLAHQRGAQPRQRAQAPAAATHGGPGTPHRGGRQVRRGWGDRRWRGGGGQI